MALADYRFVTTWKLRAPIDAVWRAIWESMEWPHWWRGVVRVEELRPGGPDGVGALSRFTWKSRLPYTLAFEMETTRVEPPRLLEGHASGELEGTGLWELDESAGITTVRYTWSVRTTRPWMNLLAPIARPFFAWNHDWVMARGAEGLARLLDAELIAK
jgi:uncharacterized protein YndB with AHSA1/START domain